MPDQRSVMHTAKWIAACTLLSRVSGLLRDILLARAFGLNWIQDAFNYAFQFPNLFRRLFGEGALAAAFVPTFTRRLREDGLPGALPLFQSTASLLLLVLLAVVVVAELIVLAAWLALEAADPSAPTPWWLPLSLTAIMLPFLVLVCLLALFSSLLNCLNSFIPAALASVMLNVVIIAATLAAPWVAGPAPTAQVFVVAVGVLVAGAAQLAFVFPAMRAQGVRLAWRVDFRDPDLRRMLLLIAPALLGQGALMISTFLDTQIVAILTRKPGAGPTFMIAGFEIAYPLEVGALSAVAYAQRLYQFPLGVLVISIATAALPALSKLADASDMDAWTHQLRSLTRMAAFEGLAAGCLMIPLAVPIVRLLFQYGEFSPAATDRTAQVLAWYGGALWAYCAQHIVLRGFYSLSDLQTPLKLSCWLIPVNLVLTLALVWVPALRESALAVSSLATSTIGIFVGLWLLGRKTGRRLLDAPMWIGLARMVLVASATGGAIALLRSALPALTAAPHASLPARAIETFGWLGAGLVIYFALAWMLRLPEAGMLIGTLWRRRAQRPE